MHPAQRTQRIPTGLPLFSTELGNHSTCNLNPFSEPLLRERDSRLKQLSKYHPTKRCVLIGIRPISSLPQIRFYFNFNESPQALPLALDSFVTPDIFSTHLTIILVSTSPHTSLFPDHSIFRILFPVNRYTVCYGM